MNTLKRLGSFDSLDFVKISRTRGSTASRSALPECAAVRMNGLSRFTIAGDAREPLANVALPQQCPLQTLPKLFVTTTRKIGRPSLAAVSLAAFKVGAQSRS